MKHDIIDADRTIKTPRLILHPRKRASGRAAGPDFALRTRAAAGLASSRIAAAPGFVARDDQAAEVQDTWLIDGSPAGLPAALGEISLTRMYQDQSQIAYRVDRAHWNAGIATEAVGALIAANPHEARTIFAEVFQSNPAAAHVLTNSGFAYLGDAEARPDAGSPPAPTWTYLRKIR